MIGLLYKEFIAVKGKIFVAFSVIHLLLLIAVIMFKIGEPQITSVYLYMMYMIISFGFVLFSISTKLIRSDDKKQIDFFIATPVNAAEYIMSKYLFMTAVFSMVTIILLIEGIIVKSNLTLETPKSLMNGYWEMMSISIGTVMGMLSVELMLCYIFNIDGRNVTTGFLIILMFVFLAYIFFGDLNIFDKINIAYIINNYKKIIDVLKVAVPIGAVALTMLSSLISVKFFKYHNK